MPDLFGVDIAGEIANAFDGQLVPGVLTRVTAGTRTPGNLTGGTNGTSTTHTFNGFIDNGSENRVAGLATSEGEFISILGGSIDIVPKVGDKVTLEGKGPYTLHELVSRDPAAALYKFKAEL